MAIFLIFFHLLFYPIAYGEGCNSAESSIHGVQNFSMDLRLETSLAAVQCYRLKPGESASVNWPASVSPSRVAHAYRLMRTSEKSYTSAIRLNFLPLMGEAISSSKMVQLQERLKKCLDMSAPYLRGPEGESLKIELSNDTAVPGTTIQLTERTIRENAGTYSTSINCPTFIHEVLHLHGLCDEYHEETIGIEVDPKTGEFRYSEAGGSTTAYDCRHLGPESSIMRNPWAAVTDSRDWAKWEFEVCIAEQGRSDQQNTCGPGGKSERRHTFLPPGVPFLAPRTSARERVLDQTARQVGLRQKTLSSILEPAHFAAITTPGCREENRLYYRCAANAYVSSSQPVFGGGSMIGMGGSILLHGNTACQATPPECRDPKRWVTGQ